MDVQITVAARARLEWHGDRGLLHSPILLPLTRPSKPKHLLMGVSIKASSVRRVLVLGKPQLALVHERLLEFSLCSILISDVYQHLR